MSKKSTQKFTEGSDVNEQSVPTKTGKGKETQKHGKHGKRGKGERHKYSKGKTFNDISYYTKNPAITEAFTKLPFNWIVGNPLPNLHNTNHIAFPAIVSYMVDWMAANNPNFDNTPWESLSAGGADILNMVASIIYMNERRANAGSTNNIEHVDVIISNLLASIDIYVNAHYINRIFRIGYSYSWKNRLIPETIFNDHFGIDYRDFISNLANYRGRYDMLVAKAKTIRTLANFSFVQAACAQFDEIFKDSDTDTGRESLIVSVKPFHHIYDPVGLESHPGGSVRLMELCDLYPQFSSKKLIYTGTPVSDSMPLMKFGTLLDIMEKQIDALIHDDDFNLIQADIEKAFGEQSGYIEVDKAPYDGVLTPVYSNEFNLMFKNGKFMPAAHEIWNTQNTGVIDGMPCVIDEYMLVNSILQRHDEDGGRSRIVWYNYQAQNADIYSNIYNLTLNIIDSESNDPSPEDIIISTRFRRDVLVGASGTIPTNWGLPAEYVAPLPTNARLVLARASSNFMTWGGRVTIVDTGATTVQKENKRWNNVTTAIPNEMIPLENHPIFTNSSGYIYTNITNIRAISPSELDPIQRACFLSLWDLPSRTNI